MTAAATSQTSSAVTRSASAPTLSVSTATGGRDTITMDTIAVDRTPTDDEINWLWDKVRSCLQSQKQQQQTGVGQHQSANSSGPRPQAASASAASQQRQITATIPTVAKQQPTATPDLRTFGNGGPNGLRPGASANYVNNYMGSGLTNGVRKTGVDPAPKVSKVTMQTLTSAGQNQQQETQPPPPSSPCCSEDSSAAGGYKMQRQYPSAHALNNSTNAFVAPSRTTAGAGANTNSSGRQQGIVVFLFTNT